MTSYLEALAPPLSEAEISGRRLELEEAIRLVERELIAHSGPFRTPPPPQVAPPVQDSQLRGNTAANLARHSRLSVAHLGLF